MASKYIKGITISIGADTQKLTKALEGVNKQSRDLQGELKQVERLLKLDPKNTELLAQKQELLSKAISNTKEKLETLKEAERQVQQQFERGEVGEEQYRAIQREVIKTEEELKNLEKQLKETNNTWKTAAENLEKFGKKATDIGKDMTKKVTLPILGIGAAAAKLGMDFEAGMSEVAAISGATGEDLTRLEEKAREMGATTKFSATEAAEGLKYMAMAGWETEQMLAGLPGVLALAAASGEDLGTVSDIVTDAMTAFGLAAEEAGHFADVLAKASSSSNTNVGLMGETFKYVAPLAGSLGYSIEDTAHAIGLMANAGIKGSQAGTALRSMLTRMIKPTKESGTAMDTLGISMTNADGTMKSLAEVMNDLREAFANLDPDQQAFYAAQIAGQEAMSGFLAIVNASDEDFIKLRDNIYDAAGAAEEMATIMQENNKGALTELMSAIEELGLKIYDILKPAIAGLIEFIQGLVDWLNNLSPEMQQIIVIVGGLAAAIGPLLIIIGQMSLGLSSLITFFTGTTAAAAGTTTAVAGATAATSGFSKVIAAITGPVGIAIAAIAGIIAVIVALWKTNEEFRENVRIIWEQIKEIFNTVLNVIKKLVTTIYNSIKNFWQKNNKEIKNITDAIWNAIQKIFNTVLKAIQGILEVFIGLFTGDWERFGNGLQTVWESIWNGIQTIFETVKTAIENLAQIFINFITSKWEGFGNTLQFIWDTVWNTIKNIIDSITTIIQGIIETFIGIFTGDWERFSDGVQTIWQGMWDGIKAIVEGAWSLLSRAFDGLWNSISDWFEDLIDSAFSWGKNMIDGFIDGIKSMISKVKSVVSSVTSAVSDFLGFHSPAKKGEGRYIVDWGQNMIEGFMEGMQKAIPDLQSTLNSVIPNMSTTINNTYNNNMELDLLKNATKPVNLVLDGKVVGRALAPIINQELNIDITKDLLGKGALQW